MGLQIFSVSFAAPSARAVQNHNQTVATVCFDALGCNSRPSIRIKGKFRDGSAGKRNQGLARRICLMRNVDLANPSVVSQDATTWEAGYKNGHAGKPTDTAPPGVDALAWSSGVIEGKADRQAGKVRPLTRKPQP